MNTKLAQMSKLVKINQASYIAIQSKFAGLTKQERMIRDQLANLKNTCHPRSIDIEHDAAIYAGADLRWDIWIECRLLDLNSELSRVLVKKSKIRKKLEISFGRCQVTKSLFSKIQSDRGDQIRKKNELEFNSVRFGDHK